VGRCSFGVTGGVLAEEQAKKREKGSRSDEVFMNDPILIDGRL